MSTLWFPLGRCKLRPEPRIAGLNLLMVFALAFASLLVGSTAGRHVQGRAHRSPHHSRLICGSRPPLEHVTAEPGRSDDLAAKAVVHRSAAARGRRPACFGSGPA